MKSIWIILSIMFLSEMLFLKKELKITNEELKITKQELNTYKYNFEECVKIYQRGCSN